MEEYLALVKTCQYLKLVKVDKSQVSIYLDFHAKPGAKLCFCKIKDNQLIISVTEKPIDGEANSAFIDYISDLFHITKKNVEIIRGLKGKKKTAQLTIGESNSRPWKKRIEDLKGLLSQLSL